MNLDRRTSTIESDSRPRGNEGLYASEERYRVLFELSPVAVYSIDASGVIQEFNRVAAELWGRLATCAELPSVVHELLQGLRGLEHDQGFALRYASLYACARLPHLHEGVLVSPVVVSDSLATGAPPHHQARTVSGKDRVARSICYFISQLGVRG